MSRLDAALTLAGYGIKVHPVSPETKAPLTRHGHIDATTNPDAIRQWWGMWPDAWPGMNLAASGLVTVAPDSPDYLADFERRGLETPARWQSPGGPGHVHHVFRRPADCPTTRICRSGEFDVLSDGYSIVYLTDAAAVPNMNGGLPDAPTWVVDMLKEAAAKKARPVQSAVVDAAVQPPVELSDYDRATWEGKHAKIVTSGERAGEVNRSSSLMAIGRALFNAGMTRRGVVAELAARDHDLNWHKYCCSRTDSAVQYHAIMDELERNGRASKAAVITPDARMNACTDELAELRAVNRGIVGIIRSEMKPAAKIASIELALEAHSSRSEDFITESNVAGRIHQSDDIVAATLKAYRTVVPLSDLRADPSPEDPPLRVAYQPRKVNPWTGGITDQPHNYIRLVPTHARLSDTLAAIAANVPDELKKTPRADRGQKAKPTPIADELIPSCPDDPDADAEQRTEPTQVARCDDCGGVLAAMTEDGTVLVPTTDIIGCGKPDTPAAPGCGRSYLSPDIIGRGSEATRRRHEWIQASIERHAVRRQIEQARRRDGGS